MFYTGHDRKYTVPERLRDVVGADQVVAWQLLSVPDEAREWADGVLDKILAKLDAHVQAVLKTDGPADYYGVPGKDDAEDTLSELLREKLDGTIERFEKGDWAPVDDSTPYSLVPLETLEEEDAAMLADALTEGSGMVRRYVSPQAWLPPANDRIPASEVLISAAGEDTWRYYAVVDELDQGAVLNLIRMAPGPKLEEYVEGKWETSKSLLSELQGVAPPPLVELDEQSEQDVRSQIDAGAVEVEGEEEEEPVTAAKTSGYSMDPRAERLRRYWSIGGKGGLKIRWNTPGDWTRCYRYLRKYMGLRAKGYCANMHKRNTGTWPGKRGRRGSIAASAVDTVILHAGTEDGLYEHIFSPGDEVEIVLAAGSGYHPMGTLAVIEHDGETLRVTPTDVEDTPAGVWIVTAGGMVLPTEEEAPSGQAELVFDMSARTAGCSHSQCRSYKTWPKLSTEAALDAAVAAGQWRAPIREEETMHDGIYTEVTEKDEMILQAVTAGAFPAAPPDEWFEDPKLSGPTPLTIEDSGRVYGHIASFDVAHIGLPGKVHAPRSKSGYAYFHTGEIVTASGAKVPVGQLTLSGGHAPLNADASAAVKHYDDTASAVVDIHVGEDQYGIWAAGSIRPTVTQDQVRALRASAPSGDWRPINGQLELVAVCQVNVPGFPIARARVASGAVMALVAAGARPLAEQKFASEISEALAEKLSKMEAALIASGLLADGGEEAPAEDAETPGEEVEETPAEGGPTDDPDIGGTTDESAEEAPVEEEAEVEAEVEEEAETEDPGDTEYDYEEGDTPEAASPSEKVQAIRAERARQRRIEELRSRVKSDGLAASGGESSPKGRDLSAKGGQVSPITAARRWRSWLHPRGRDGRFIEKFSFVNIFENQDGSGRRYRAKVVNLTEEGMTVEYRSRTGKPLPSPNPSFPNFIPSGEIKDRASTAPKPKARINKAESEMTDTERKNWTDYDHIDRDGKSGTREQEAAKAREVIVSAWQTRTDRFNADVDDSNSLNSSGEGVSTDVNWDDLEVDMSNGVEEAFRQISAQLDPKFVAHQEFVADTVRKAEEAGLNIESFLTDPQDDTSWPQELKAYSQALVKDIIANADSRGVPREKRAVVLGGLPGAGKTTMIRNMGMDPKDWIMLNPDDIKERMIDDGIFPEIKGLSPMESVGVMHEFSSYVAKQATRAAMRDGYNVIHDVTLANDKAAGKVEALNSKWGYEADGVFVDVSMEMSAKSQIKRHLGGLNRLRTGTNDGERPSSEGGRYVPTRVLGASASNDPDYRSTNRKAFENYKNTGALRRWVVFDNNNYANKPLAVGQRNAEIPGDVANLYNDPQYAPGLWNPVAPAAPM